MNQTEVLQSGWECTQLKPMPRRLQRKRTKGWTKPEGAVCVTRPGPFGNPFDTAERFEHALRFALTVLRYNREFTSSYVPLAPREQHMMRIAQRLGELRGHDLLCFCPLAKPCHADTLIRFANTEQP